MGRIEDVAVTKIEAFAPAAAIDAFVTSRVAWVLGNRGRCRMLFHIAESEGMTVREVAQRAGIDRHYAYQHVKRLKQLGWISAARRGSSRVYRCSNSDIRRLVIALRGIAADSFLEPEAGYGSPAETVGDQINSADEK